MFDNKRIKPSPAFANKLAITSQGIASVSSVPQTASKSQEEFSEDARNSNRTGTIEEATNSYAKELLSDYAGKKTDMKTKISSLAKLYEAEARGENVSEQKAKLLDEIANGAGMNYDVSGAKAFYDVLYNSIGVDGSIATWEQDNGASAKVYVTFRSEQSKYTTNKNPTRNEDLRYSLRKGAEKDVEKALNNKNYTEDVYLTETSPLIIASQKGVRNLPMVMKASHIRENVFTEEEAKKRGLQVNKGINYHGLGKDLFLKIIDGLDDVKLAYRGTKNASHPSRRENYFLLVSQFKEEKGNMVNVPVYVNEKGQFNRVFFETNKIATVFGRDNFFEYVDREIKTEILLE